MERLFVGWPGSEGIRWARSRYDPDTWGARYARTAVFTWKPRLVLCLDRSSRRRQSHLWLMPRCQVSCPQCATETWPGQCGRQIQRSGHRKQGWHVQLLSKEDCATQHWIQRWTGGSAEKSLGRPQSQCQRPSLQICCCRYQHFLEINQGMLMCMRMMNFFHTNSAQHLEFSKLMNRPNQMDKY